jgi:hypothetical protein
VRLRPDRTPFFVVSLPGTGRHTGLMYSERDVGTFTDYMAAKFSRKHCCGHIRLFFLRGCLNSVSALNTEHVKRNTG